MQQQPQPAGELLLELLKTEQAKQALLDAPPSAPVRRLQEESSLPNRCADCVTGALGAQPIGPAPLIVVADFNRAHTLQTNGRRLGVALCLCRGVRGRAQPYHHTACTPHTGCRDDECKLATTLRLDAASCMCDETQPYFHCHAREVSETDTQLSDAVDNTRFGGGYQGRCEGIQAQACGT